MGASASNPRWSRSHGTGYDQWGFIPPEMAKPSQHLWSQFYQDAAVPRNLDGSKPYVSGQANDILSAWGSGMGTGLNMSLQNNDYGNKYKAFYPNCVSEGQPDTDCYGFARQVISNVRKPGSSTDPFPAVGSTNWGNTCTPENFPNCELATMRDRSDIVTPHANFYYQVETPGQATADWAFPAQSFSTCENGQSADGSTCKCAYSDAAVQYVFAMNEQQPGKPVDTFERWRESVDRVVSAYKDNQLTGLENINTQDTSNYDPCNQESFLDVLLPTLIAGVGTALIRVYGFEFVAFLEPQEETTTMATVAIFTLLDNMTKSAIILDRKDEYVQTAAGSFCLFGGFAVGYQIMSMTQWNDQEYCLLAGLALGEVLSAYFQPVLAKALSVGSLGLTLLLAPVLIVKWIKRFFCKLSNYSLTACEDTCCFPDARRWDVASLAAALTDRVCAQEGWERGDQRAEYVLRGLMQSPAMMAAATGPDRFPGLWARHSSAYGGTPTPGETYKHRAAMVNPIGSFAPVQAYLTGSKNMIVVDAEDENQACDASAANWQLDEKIDFGNPDGFVVSAADGQQQNRFACNNLDAMLNGMENSDLTNESDLTLANNLKNWVATLTESAKNPLNRLNMENIPGWSTRRRVLPTAETFLKHCNEDELTSGYGFNNWEERGLMAHTLYGTSSLPEQTKLWVNAMFSSFGTMEQNWEWIRANFDERNTVAWAHYVSGEFELASRGDLQLESYEKWRNGYEGVKKFLELHPFDAGFTNNPFRDRNHDYENTNLTIDEIKGKNAVEAFIRDTPYVATKFAAKFDALFAKYTFQSGDQLTSDTFNFRPQDMAFCLLNFNATSPGWLKGTYKQFVDQAPTLLIEAATKGWGDNSGDWLNQFIAALNTPKVLNYTATDTWGWSETPNPILKPIGAPVRTLPPLQPIQSGGVDIVIQRAVSMITNGNYAGAGNVLTAAGDEDWWLSQSADDFLAWMFVVNVLYMNTNPSTGDFIQSLQLQASLVDYTITPADIEWYAQSLNNGVLAPLFTTLHKRIQQLVQTDWINGNWGE